MKLSVTLCVNLLRSDAVNFINSFKRDAPPPLYFGASSRCQAPDVMLRC